MTEFGKVVCSGTGRYEWTIDDFLCEDSSHFSSPRFSYLGEVFYIELDRDGDTLNLNLRSRGSPCESLHVALRIKTGGEGKREYSCGETDCIGYFRMGNWLYRLGFSKITSENLRDGKLTVFYELKWLKGNGSPASLQETPPIVEKLQSDFKSILDSGEDCDVTLKVGDKEFLAHRIFLRARSPVFKSVFSHEMLEKQSGVVVIGDCDAATFQDFLNYLYTGSTQHVSDENVCQLYAASDKYQVEDLKEACAAYMKKHLSVGNFCDILTLAVRHSDKELIDRAAQYFSCNAMEIATSAAWQTFLCENPTTGNELFLKHLSREKMRVELLSKRNSYIKLLSPT